MLLYKILTVMLLFNILRKIALTEVACFVSHSVLLSGASVASTS